MRLSCALLLDDISLTGETIAALQRCLEDPHPNVRKAALHAVTCEHCKPDGCVLYVRPVYERMARDPDRLVRKSVISSLGWTTRTTSGPSSCCWQRPPPIRARSCGRSLPVA